LNTLSQLLEKFMRGKLFELPARSSTIRDYDNGKTLEVRPWTIRTERRTYPGQILELSSYTRTIRRRITRKTTYQGIAAVMAAEKLSAIFPGVMDERTFVRRAREYYPEADLEKISWIVLEVTIV
jgi:hypothetical protein